MWIQFFLENAHFAINLLSSLVMFAIFWLYFDAWQVKKTVPDTFKIVGFLLLSISFLIHATFVESTVLTSSIFGSDINVFIVSITRILGYLLVVISLLSDPLQPRPKLTMTILPLFSLPILFPLGAIVVGFLYLRRATIGLENHLKRISLSFFILGLAEFLNLATLYEMTNNVDIYNLVAPFGPLWIIQHLLQLIAVVILLIWVFGYLLKRFQTQLFMIFTTTIVAIFLVITVTFTGLLLKNLQDETLSRLNTDVKVLDYALTSQKAQTLSDAQVLALDPQVIAGLSETGGKSLSDIAESFLLNKKEGTLLIVNENGQVAARGEDRERKGDSVSDDPLIKRAFLGQSSSSVVTKDGVLAPEISIRSASPVKKDNKIIGAVMTGTVIDNAFVDGLKKATGLEASLYGDNRLSATTLVTQDGKSRPLGIKEEDNRVKEMVLGKGVSYSTSLNLLGQPYFAAFLPLRDVDTNTVGMLFVGRPQVGVLQTAGQSIELTYLVSVGLLVISLLPSYLIAKYLAEQLN